MGYVGEIRKLIGNKPLILCACGCLVFNEENKVLLQRRKDNGLWGNPGGCMEFGETIYETAIREVQEETGFEIKDLEIFNIYSGDDQYHIYPNGDVVSFVNIIFKTSNYTGSLKVLSDESLENAFFAIEEIPENITGPFVNVLKDLKSLKLKTN